MTLTAVDLFCGAGGLSLGFMQEGFDVLLGIDNDLNAVETYVANFGPRALCANLLTYSAAEAQARVGRDVDVVLGGPSCQPFSTHGRHQRWVVGDPRSDLWSRMFEYVEELRPRAFLMENVPGMLYYARGTFVESLAKAFAALGYTLTHELVLAADYNVPQLRRRLIVVGLRGDEPFVFPAAPRLGGWRRDGLDKGERRRIALDLLPHVTLREALGTLPRAVDPDMEARYTDLIPSGPYDGYLREYADPVLVRDHERVPLIDEVARLITYVPPGGTWRDIPPHLLPNRFRSMRRTDSTNLYGRMVWDRPAYTMTTQFQNITTGCFIHPDEDRPLTIREAARVQSFPDSFPFAGSLGVQQRLIGNAVPPLLARAFARSLADHLLHRRRGGPLIVGPERHRGVPVPGGAEAASSMRSGGRHDDAARSRLVATLEGEAVPDHVAAGTDTPIDVALPDRRIALFVQGCFIYGCPTCARGTKSQTWWKAEIDRRVADRAAQRVKLEALGWTVLTVWEHEDPSVIGARLRFGDPN